MRLAAVIECLKQNKGLYRLKLGRNKIGAKAAKALAAYLSMDTCQLTELDLSQSGIDANTFGLLCRGILKRWCMRGKTKLV